MHSAQRQRKEVRQSTMVRMQKIRLYDSSASEAACTQNDSCAATGCQATHSCKRARVQRAKVDDDDSECDTRVVPELDANDPSSAESKFEQDTDVTEPNTNIGLHKEVRTEEAFIEVARLESGSCMEPHAGMNLQQVVGSGENKVSLEGVAGNKNADAQEPARGNDTRLADDFGDVERTRKLVQETEAVHADTMSVQGRRVVGSDAAASGAQIVWGENAARHDFSGAGDHDSFCIRLPGLVEETSCSETKAGQIAELNFEAQEHVPAKGTFGAGAALRYCGGASEHCLVSDAVSQRCEAWKLIDSFDKLFPKISVDAQRLEHKAVQIAAAKRTTSIKHVHGKENRREHQQRNNHKDRVETIRISASACGENHATKGRCLFEPHSARRDNQSLKTVPADIFKPSVRFHSTLSQAQAMPKMESSKLNRSLRRL
jgi:hypothetical protein